MQGMPEEGKRGPAGVGHGTGAIGSAPRIEDQPLAAAVMRALMAFKEVEGERMMNSFLVQTLHLSDQVLAKHGVVKPKAPAEMQLEAMQNRIVELEKRCADGDKEFKYLEQVASMQREGLTRISTGVSDPKAYAMQVRKWQPGQPKP
jgi:hypothetical protein